MNQGTRGESVVVRKDRIETPQLILVRAILPILEAEQAFFEASHRWHESTKGLPLSEWPKNEKELSRECWTLRERFQELLGAGDLADNSWDRLLQAKKGEPWPEPPDDFDSRDLAMLSLRSNPESRWGMWYVLYKSICYERNVCIGTCAFRAPPSAEGSVEIAYWIVDRYQAVDLIAEAVGALVNHAFEETRVQRVMAEASARHVPTIRVLGKNGFRRVGPGRAPGSLIFQRDRISDF